MFSTVLRADMFDVLWAGEGMFWVDSRLKCLSMRQVLTCLLFVSHTPGGPPLSLSVSVSLFLCSAFTAKKKGSELYVIDAYGPLYKKVSW